VSRPSSAPSERAAVSRLSGKGYTPRRVRRLLRPEILVIAAGAVALAGAAWRVSAGPERPTVPQRDRDGAIAAVRSFISLSTHLRGSGGDERFADRIPAYPAVVAELMTDVERGRRRGREEESRLVRADVRDVRPSLAFHVEVRMKEYWVTRSSPGGADVRSDVLLVRYFVRRDGGAWKIADWDLELGADAQEGAP